VSITFRPAKREHIPLLLGVAGGTGSGKTMSALLLARGLAAGHPFAGIDTENGRMNHYADLFPELRVAQITAPFRPSKYADAIDAGAAFLEAQNVPVANRVIVVDSMSHEWAGDGGCTEWHDDLMGNDQSKNFSAWIAPKKDHKKMVTRLLQVNAHVILAFRAEPKTEVIDDPNKPGKKLYIEKRSLTGLNGWIPISEKNLPYELTASFLLMADRPGVPLPIKLQEQHKPFVPLNEPLSAEVGVALGAWASGEPGAAVTAGAPGSPDDLLAEFLALAPEDARDAAEEWARGKMGELATDDARAKWLTRQIDGKRKAAVA
jgi:hypothetical protein